jgi:hypothetical protein
MAEQNLQKGEEAMQDGKYEDAVKLFQLCIDEISDDYYFYDCKARCLMQWV